MYNAFIKAKLNIFSKWKLLNGNMLESITQYLTYNHFVSLLLKIGSINMNCTQCFNGCDSGLDVDLHHAVQIAACIRTLPD